MPQKISNIIPIPRFIALYVMTGGLYTIYWSYHVWKFVRSHKKISIHIFTRAFLYNIFMMSLLYHVKTILKENGYVVRYPPIILGFVFLVLSILGNIPYWFTLCIGLLGFIPLLPAVMGMNRFYTTQEDSSYIKRLRRGEIIFLGLGAIGLILIFVSVI